jgi:hypothetical protein
MQRRIRLILAGGAAVAAAGAAILLPGQFALTADHLDPPTRTDPAFDTTGVADTAADIADVYAFHDADNAYFAVTFAGPADAGTPAVYDRNVLYTLNISTTAPATSADVSIRWRFGPGTNGTGSGVSVENVPGVNGAIVGPVEAVLTSSNGTNEVKAYAGLRDDPFFFDLQGFRQTVATGTLSFVSTRNFFAGQNDTAFVIGIPKARLGAGPLDVWATTARFGGQI